MGQYFFPVLKKEKLTPTLRNAASKLRDMTILQNDKLKGLVNK